jgi:hypothetical protein
MCLVCAELNHTTLNKTGRLTKQEDLSVLEYLYLLNFNFSNLISGQQFYETHRELL